MTDWTKYKRFGRFVDVPCGDLTGYDGIIIEIGKDEQIYADNIQAAHDQKKDCTLLFPYGLNDYILDFGFQSSEWNPMQLPAIVELKQHLDNKDVDDIIIDISKIVRPNGKYFTAGWIETYTDYVTQWLKDNYPQIGLSVLIRQSVWSYYNSVGGLQNLTNLINAWGVSIINPCNVTDDLYPTGDYVPLVPGDRIDKLVYGFYHFPKGEPWLAYKMEPTTTDTTTNDPDTTDDTTTEGTTDLSDHEMITAIYNWLFR